MNKQKLLIGVVAVVVIGLGAYLYLSGSSDEPATGTLVSQNTGDDPAALGNLINPEEIPISPFSSPEGAEIAALLGNINNIKLDQRVLSSPPFRALVDSSILLPDVTTSGRANPFSLSGGTLGPTTTTPAQ